MMPLDLRSTIGVTPLQGADLVTWKAVNRALEKAAKAPMEAAGQHWLWESLQRVQAAFKDADLDSVVYEVSLIAARLGTPEAMPQVSRTAIARRKSLEKGPAAHWAPLRFAERRNADFKRLYEEAQAKGHGRSKADRCEYVRKNSRFKNPKTRKPYTARYISHLANSNFSL